MGVKFRIFHDGKMYYLDKGKNLMLTFFSDGIPWGLYDKDRRLVTGDPDTIVNTPGVLMMGVSIKDKLFFEGDIVEYYLDNMIGETLKYVDIIAFEEDGLCGDGYVPISILEDWGAEVIGNIHEHPEKKPK